MKKLKIFTLFLFTTLYIYAYSPNDLRFHCGNDTIKINQLLNQAEATQHNSPGDIMLYYATELLGTPYVAHTLEGDNEKLTINIDELDCTTFVETLIALTKTTLENRKTWRDYAKNLESVRYRNGNINGYASRLHYISDWIINNSARGNLKEATSDFPDVNYYVKTIDFMSKNKDLYKSLKNDSAMLEEIKKVEIGYRSHRLPNVRKALLNNKGVKKCFKNGDIIALMTKAEGLDTSHLGIIKLIDGTPYLLHASYSEKKVVVDKDNLYNMLRKMKSITGVRIIRVVE